MASLNKVQIIGNAGRDPEVKYSATGLAVANLSIATTRTWKDKQGEKAEETEWHRVVIFNEALAKVAEQYLKKGSTIYIEGQLQTRKWTDKDGAEKYSTEIVLQQYRGELVMLGGKPDTQADIAGTRAGAKQSSRNELDDGVPF